MSASVLAAEVLVPTSSLSSQTGAQPVEAGASARLEIAFLAGAPAIDGILDPEVIALPAVPLPVSDTGGGAMPAAPVLARLAYGADFLHLGIEAAQDRIQWRDRGAR